MLQIKVNKDEFEKINALLPDVCPNISFALKLQDDNLEALGLCDSAPCIVEFDLSTEEFYEMLDILNDIEIDAFNTPGSTHDESNLAHQKYLKYGCLYDILSNAEMVKE